MFHDSHRLHVPCWVVILRPFRQVKPLLKDQGMEWHASCRCTDPGASRSPCPERRATQQPLGFFWHQPGVRRSWECSLPPSHKLELAPDGPGSSGKAGLATPPATAPAASNSLTAPPLSVNPVIHEDSIAPGLAPGCGIGYPPGGDNAVISPGTAWHRRSRRSFGGAAPAPSLIRTRVVLFALHPASIPPAVERRVPLLLIGIAASLRRI